MLQNVESYVIRHVQPLCSLPVARRSKYIFVQKQTMSIAVSLLDMFVFIYSCVIGIEGLIGWHYIPRCVVIMEMLQKFL